MASIYSVEVDLDRGSRSTHTQVFLWPPWVLNSHRARLAVDLNLPWVFSQRPLPFVPSVRARTELDSFLCLCRWCCGCCCWWWCLCLSTVVWVFWWCLCGAMVIGVVVLVVLICCCDCDYGCVCVCGCVIVVVVESVEVVVFVVFLLVVVVVVLICWCLWLCRHVHLSHL